MMSLLQILLLHNTRITTTRMAAEVTIKIISFPIKNGYGHKPSRSSNDGPNQGYQNNNTKRPQC